MQAKNKFITKTLKIFKNSIRCFSPLHKRSLEGKIHFITLSNDLLFIDFGFKYEVECFTNELHLRIPKTLSLKNKCNYIKSLSLITFEIIFLQSFFFNKILIKKKKKIMNLKVFRDIFLLDKKKNKYRKKNRQTHKKSFVKGRFLNIIRGGFSIGIFGHIVFLPSSHALFKSFGQLSLFYFLFVDLKKCNAIVSQRKITGVLKKQLEKLGSRFITKKRI